MSLRILSTTLTLLLSAPALAAAPADAAPAAKAAPERLTPAQMIEQAGLRLEALRGLVAQVDNLVLGTGAEKDMVRLNCVKDKQAQLKRLLWQSEQAQGALEAHLARNRMEAAHEAYGLIVAAGAQGHGLRAQAEECLGETVLLPERTFEEDRADFEPPAPEPVRVRPPAASPAE